MVFDVELLTQLEKLAALDDPDASAEQRAARCSDLARILEHVRSLERIGPLPGDGALAPAATLRADTPLPGLPRDVALAAAPHADESTFVVPRIVP